mgnify:CR=1 FL=1
MKVQILVLNSGSSSLKFQLIEMPEERVICDGMAERIGTEAGRLKMRMGQQVLEEGLGPYRKLQKRLMKKPVSVTNLLPELVY